MKGLRNVKGAFPGENKVKNSARLTGRSFFYSNMKSMPESPSFIARSRVSLSFSLASS